MKFKYVYTYMNVIIYIFNIYILGIMYALFYAMYASHR